MPTREQVQEQLRSLDGVSKFFGKREIDALPSILWPDEVITSGVQGMYNSRNGLLVGTTRRLIFVEKSLLGRLTVEDFPYDKITSIQYETGWVLGQIKIFASGNRADISHIAKEQVQPFAEAVRARISGGSAIEPPAAQSPQSDSGGDLLDKLERLSVLHASGALSDDEFTQAKGSLLAGARR